VGQKTHPYGFRLGIIKPWRSRYYARHDFPELLKEDDLIRKYLKTRLSHAAIADIHIERKPGKVTVTVHTGRPGVVIGKRGAEVDKLRDELAQLTGKEVGINVEEIKRPELDAQLVGDSVAHQLTQRISFRRAMKRAVQSAMRMGAQGIKIKTARFIARRNEIRWVSWCATLSPTSWASSSGRLISSTLIPTSLPVSCASSSRSLSTSAPRFPITTPGRPVCTVTVTFPGFRSMCTSAIAAWLSLVFRYLRISSSSLRSSGKSRRA